MGFGFGDLLSLGGTLLGGLGQDEPKRAEQSTGFNALPKEVRDAWIKTFLPAAMAQFQQPYKAMPMKRYQPTGTAFDSAAMQDLQNYSDQMGGLFTPFNQSPAKPAATTPPSALSDLVPKVEQKGTANKSSGTYYSPEQALQLLAQGISTPSIAAYLGQLMGVK